MPKQTSIQLTEATQRQVSELQAAGFGSFTDINRIAIDRMYREEIKMKIGFEMKARARVANSDNLSKHEKLIFGDWPNWDEHVEWVANAPYREIKSWLDTIIDDITQEEKPDDL